MSSLHATTIVARNYLPFARVLAASFRKHHPDGVFAALLLDDTDHCVSDETAGMELIRPEDVIEIRELQRMALMYNILEFSTAVKPFLLRHLLDRGWPHAVYLDPDISIYRPIDDLGELAEREDLVLTPHTLVPMARDERKPTEYDILATGVFNLGFVGVGPSSTEFLDYWSARLRRDCISDPVRMLFTDQRWVDLAPGYFKHHIATDPSINVAYWNADRRELKRVGAEYRVNEVPLRFFHFSGFDPSKPYILSKYQGREPRVLLSEQPVLAELCQEYAAALIADGWSVSSGESSYAYDSLPNGTPVDSHMRRAYREAVVAAESGQGDEPPNPFTDGSAQRFVDWLAEPARPGVNPQVSRYLETLYRDRPDRQIAFPVLTGLDGDRFIDWVIVKGQKEENIPLPLLPRPRLVKEELRSVSEPAGVNVAGFFQSELGVGEVARLLVDVLEMAGEPVSTYLLTARLSRQEAGFVDRAPSNAPFDINILCANADGTVGLRAEVDEDGFFSSGYTIATWAWETEDFPESMHGAFAVVDEIWAISSFAAEAIRRHTSKPVFAIPLAVAVPSVPETDFLIRIGLGGRFTFLFLFDYLSVLDRKNPVGLIEAFSKAFTPDDGPALLIKTINGDKAPLAQEALRAAAVDRPDVFVVDGYLGPQDRFGLIGECNAYVSLHRGEGFGLTMAEAMSLGKPVIATAYSGNCDYMTQDNSFLVDFDMVEIPVGCHPYPAGCLWAEPDLEEAARLMRLVVDRPDVANQRGQRAQEEIRSLHSVQSRAALVSGRLNEIREARRPFSNTESERSARDPLDTARELVAAPPAAGDASKYGRAGLVIRRALIRLLRPYWFGQRKLDETLVDLAREERRRRDQSVDEISRHVKAAEERVSSVTDSVSPMTSYLSRLGDELSYVQRRVDLVEQRMQVQDRADGSPGQSDGTLLKPAGRAQEQWTAGGLDLPEPLEAKYPGPVHISGWALAAPYPVVQVEIRIDGVGSRRARLGLPRPDVAMLESAVEAPVCGFESWLDLSVFETRDEEFHIEAIAVAGNGSSFTLGSRRVIIETDFRKGPRAPVTPLPTPLARIERTRSDDGQRRVLVFADDLERGGAQLALLDILSSLTRAASLTLVSSSDGPLRAPLEALGIEVVLTSPIPLHDSDEYRRCLAELIHQFSGVAYDAVIVNTFVPFWGIEVADALSAPSLWALHEFSAPEMFWAGWARDAHKRVHPRVLARAQAALVSATEVVVSTPALKALLTRYRPNGEFRIVREAIDAADLARRSADMDSAAARMRAGIATEDRVILCAGSIQPPQGQVVLAQAMRMVRRQHPHARLVLIGSAGNPYAQGLSRYLSRAGLAGETILEGPVDDVVPWYSIADVVVSASDNELQSYVLLEAMACGVPVVAMDVGGVPDVVRPDVTGYLAEPSNILSLAVAIDRALGASISERTKIAKASHALVSAQHLSSQRNAAYEVLLRRLVDEVVSTRRAIDQ